MLLPLTPCEGVAASTDLSTGHRRYEQSQIGRVQAVASLRPLGFG